MKNRKVISVIVGIAAILLGVGYVYSTRSVTVYGEKDEKVKIASDSRCAKTCVFIWSSNCSACLYSLPHINILQQHLAMNDGKLIMVLENDHVQLRGMAKAYFVRLNMANAKTYVDIKQALQKRYNIKVFPTMLIFDSKGKLVRKSEGFVPWAQGEKVQEVLALINQ